MAKRGNYKQDKRRKELKRKKKQEAKLERRRVKKQGSVEGERGEGGEELAPVNGEQAQPDEKTGSDEQADS